MSEIAWVGRWVAGMCQCSDVSYREHIIRTPAYTYLRELM